LVSFLRTYGPSAQADVLSDENVQAALDRFGVKAIEVAPPKLEALTDALMGPQPRNVILTGTAGDGKTFHIRQYLLGRLGVDPMSWPGDRPVLEVQLPSGQLLRVIRDLSELEDEDKDAELAALISCLKGERGDVRYLVAANDGQLLRYFRATKVAGAEEIHSELACMLRDERSVGSLDVVLLNLSRSWSAATVDAIFEAVLTHPDWDDGCMGCPGIGDENPCPIRLNRSILSGEIGGHTFRERLKAALRLGAANDSHVPVRYLIMLVVNILLGDRDHPDDPMLDCSRAMARAAQGRYQSCSPYDNALGLNVTEGRRTTNVVFSLLGALGLGDETNNLLDEAIGRGEPADLWKQIFDGETFYGTRLFEPARHAYFVAADRSKADIFRRSLSAQRRRAFFRLSDENEGPASPWRLTVLHHAGLYLKVIEALEQQGGDRQLLDQVTRRLIKGLNRTYLGMMTEETDALWLAGTIGRTDDTVGRISTIDGIKRASRSENLKLEIGDGAHRPCFRVKSVSAIQEIPPLDLRPLLFEYLLRVEEGSLPATFSRQCQQELRQFALIAAEAFDNELEFNSVHVLSLAASGTVDAKTLEI
jgi:hypothetical protein